MGRIRKAAGLVAGAALLSAGGLAPAGGAPTGSAPVQVSGDPNPGGTVTVSGTQCVGFDNQARV